MTYWQTSQSQRSGAFAFLILSSITIFRKQLFQLKDSLAVQPGTRWYQTSDILRVLYSLFSFEYLEVLPYCPSDVCVRVIEHS
ncbi:hypothetical protein DENSPDRAFT_842379 [Dentipellis sp. KUC8613]|nr:hypothetical protein DENSPDRAFT_842379 [Dentipellis sp. KUC8613]